MEPDFSKMIPAEWLEALHAVQTVAPGAVIAGGALRDLFLGRPFKDLDIFVHLHDPANDRAAIFSALTALGFCSSGTIDFSYAKGMTKECYAADSFTRSVMAFGCIPVVGLLEVQIVVLNEPFKLSRMDFGLCQIAYDGDALTYSDEFMHDAVNEVFTVCRADTEDELARSRRRYERLHNKYPGWNLVLSYGLTRLFPPA